MAKARAVKTKAIPVPYATLAGLLGKPVDDPAVTKMLAKAGKVSVKSDFILAKEAGFDYSIERPEGAKRKALSALFLFPEGKDGHRGYADLPKGFTFTTRAELLAALPAPHTSWKLGKGKVPVDTNGVLHDTWTIDGLDVCASYRQSNEVGHITVSLPDDATGGQDFSTHPLHFATRPVDAPKDAELVGMALLVAWAATRIGLPNKHAGTALGKQLLAKQITPRAFLVQACGKKLSSLDFDPTLGDFLYEYLHQVTDDEGARAKADAKIAKLLGLEDAERRTYNDDYLATFADAVESPFYVPDRWDAVDRLAPVLDARWADFRATRFLEAPEVARYEKAAKARDAVKVQPDRGNAPEPKGGADDTLADDLVALIGKAVKDPAVKAVLERAGLPIGKKIDQQANPSLGVSYMAANFVIGGKRQLGVDSVTFYAAKRKSYIRSVHAELEFAGYPAKLPRGLALGAARAQVAKTLGKPRKSSDDRDYWDLSKTLKLSCQFQRDKLVQIHVHQPVDY